MKALVSALGGFCLVNQGESYPLVNLGDMSTVPPECAHILYGAIDDWEPIERSERGAILLEAQKRHNCARVVANIELCLIGISDDLQNELLKEVEDIQKVYDLRNAVVAELLRAPLTSTEHLQFLVKRCLSEGFAATASLLEEIRESQPQLNRLVDRWLSISDLHFAEFGGDRQQVWRIAVRAGIVSRTLTTRNYSEVSETWRLLAFQLVLPAERSAILRIAKEVASALFPNHLSETSDYGIDSDQYSEESTEIARPSTLSATESQVSFERALSQIDAISKAVAAGRDAIAMQYMDELVDLQTAQRGGHVYAAKSLCNIAKNCADMYRTDFEFECLNRAASINPQDGWTLVQFADHLKRVGRFDDAIAYLHRAAQLGEKAFATKALADVYVQMGQYQAAIEIYESLPGSTYDPVVRTAKADILRRTGFYDRAEEEYDQMIKDGLENHRVSAGKAEIAKRRGRLAESRKIYEDLLKSDEVDESGLIVYRLALSNVLLRAGELEEAYELTDSVVQVRPFSIQAKAFRAAIQALLGDPNAAINDFPVLGQSRAINEWIGAYVRGLLLLMLHRNVDALDALLQNIESKFLDKDAEAMLRLGAAACYLRSNKDLSHASDLLNEIPNLNDAFAESIRAALQYHIAVSRNQADDIAKLEAQLASENDKDVRALVTAIRNKNWDKARKLEIRTLLRLAA